jgi:quinolinate synthase
MNKALASTLFQPLPNLEDYERFSEEHLLERIEAKKKELGSDLVILGHHYQRSKIVKLSDFVGDSFGLSQKAAHADGHSIVFCGVRFMAESAAILCKPEQKVFHPDPDAGCPMADMANMEQVWSAWQRIHELIGAAKPKVGDTEQTVVPVTYMNSTADLKAFCGENNGIVCTSSNADRVYKWAFDRGEKIFFFPDEHLGRNTGKKMGLPESEMVLWDPKKTDGGVDVAALKNASVILWAGHCPVHMEFKARDVAHVRKFFPGCKVVVHPECDKDTVAAADASGSTEFILNYVKDLPPKSTVFVGTEVNMVERLQTIRPDVRVFKLQRSLCLTMYQINLANLSFTLEHLDTLEKVILPESVKHFAKVALDRMLAV